MDLEKGFELLKFLLLGIFQGFTEPIPISSSGHLGLAQYYFDIDLPGFSFELFVNFASLIAVLIIYRSDLIRLTVNGLSYITKRDEKSKADFLFIIYLIIGTIPAGVIGVLYGDWIESMFDDGVKMIGAMLLVTAIALFLIRNLRGHKGDRQLSIKDALIVGLAQAIALIPGISRSGATIVGAMAIGMKQETALRFSFLLYIPVSVGGVLLGISDLLETPNLNELFIPYTVAFIGSLVASYFSLKWFMNVMAKGNLIIFSIYCFVVGGLVVLFS
ncbi:undecaprenyl-diphosphate phosphatase [Bacillus solimangrovi]|uniref:Undecaprenyl-diphosphatase n=1 Tax=Bacillus solimangrovi TaxID=1305675 RepID=A0A1E5LC21_9BACI|nr:undecaprenyl-diphosphate phosphatase [Bacillus solimangrovi]OEH91638.1 UDP pyrophosphate phosphatase [Bacillus solimangrovi]